MSSWIEETNKKLQDFRDSLRDETPDWAAVGGYMKEEDVWNPDPEETLASLEKLFEIHKNAGAEQNLRDETPITEGEIKVEDVWNPELREQYQRQQELKTSWAKGGHVKGTDDDFYETDVEYAFEDKVKEVVDGISRMLFEKNRKYGDAALNPSRIFSKADSMEQLRTRIDDKLNRIKNAQDDEDEDVVKDLIGYLILLTISRGH